MILPACAKEEETLKQAIDLWGIDSQFRMLQEECAELIVATSHLLRNRSTSEMINVIEEIADVLIMIQQVVLHFDHHYFDGETMIHEYISQKMLRLKERIAEAKEEGNEQE